MFAEDLTQFFRTDDFAIAATWSVGPATVKGIFDAAYLRALGMVDATGPVFVCAAADMPGVDQGQTLTIAGTVYLITGVEPDGTGVLTVQLRKNS